MPCPDLAQWIEQIERGRLRPESKARLLEYLRSQLDNQDARQRNIDRQRQSFSEKLRDLIQREAELLRKDRPEIDPATAYRVVSARVQARLNDTGNRLRPKPCRQTIDRALGADYFRKAPPEKKVVNSIYTVFPRPSYSLQHHST